jgi:hypothetical protein
MKSQLIKWDASVVGEHPPLGRWVKGGRTVKVTTKAPRRIVAKAARWLGFEWVLGVDAATMPGCIEIINIEPDKAPVTVFQRN